MATDRPGRRCCICRCHGSRATRWAVHQHSTPGNGAHGNSPGITGNAYAIIVGLCDRAMNEDLQRLLDQQAKDLTGFFLIT